MNRTEWLYLASMDMPAGVKERVRAETLAHLEDANALQAAEVRDILGSPQRVNRDLRRLYLTEKEWDALNTRQSGWTFIDWLSVVAWPLLLLWAQIKGTPATIAPGRWLLIGLLLTSVTIFYMSTQKLHAIRRKRWRYAMIMLTGFAVQWPYFAQLFEFHRDPEQLLSAFFPFALLTVSLSGYVRNDQKLSRTMKTERYKAQGHA